jgi:hypothetical protein
MEAASREESRKLAGRRRVRKPGRAESGERAAQERISWSPSGLALLSISEMWLMVIL